jgi:phosphatidate phosphatase APP1
VAGRAARFWPVTFRRRRPLLIVPYLGYGTPDKLALCGRVLRDPRIPVAGAAESRRRNLIEFYKRLESDEVPGARVRARFDETETEVVADGEGYFSVELIPAGGAQAGAWHDVELELVYPGAGVRATGRVLVPPDSARFGVISDIDDTVIVSGVTRKASMLMRLALSSARTRKPFKGVAAFYRALQADVNPFFYVSKSPWNLYEPLMEFFDRQRLPTGPLLLRDYGRHLIFGGEERHKLVQIERVLATYPALPFILVGDSGEQDPEIYAAIVRAHPDRVRAIYIRSVRPHASRVAAIERLIEEVAPTGCQLVLAPDSEFAAAHAAGEGLIPAAALRAVRADKTLDAHAAP